MALEIKASCSNPNRLRLLPLPIPHHVILYTEGLTQPLQSLLSSFLHSMAKRISAMADCKLQEDIMLCVLTRLPVKSLYRFKCVCKPWLSLFSTSDFLVRHREATASNPEYHSLATFTFDFDRYCSFFSLEADSTIIEFVAVSREFPRESFRLDLVGSYNGLIGLICRFFCQIILWNPATYRWKFVCVVDALKISRSNEMYSVGMGFDSATNDFKVLSIVGRCHRTLVDGDDLEVKASVYSANRDCWEEVKLGFKFCVTNTINDAILSGVPYWRGLVKSLSHENRFSEVFMRYDVKNGVFDHIPVPKLDDVDVYTTTCLVEWKNCPAVLVHSPEKDNNVVGVVIFDECQGEWTTKFSIGIPIARQINYCKGTIKILLETPKGKVFLFDLETNRKEFFPKSACTLEGVAFNYIESLAHLNDMKWVKEKEGRIQFCMELDSMEQGLRQELLHLYYLNL